MFGAKRPLVASIIPTNRCNLRCPYCGRWERPGPEFSVDHWLGIVRELARLGCVRLSVTGGEPLLFKGLETILKEAKIHGMGINLNTNGVLLPKKMEILSWVDSVTISMDGTKEVHDPVRGEGTYDAALKAAGIARNAGKTLSFYTVLSQRNLESLTHVAIMARQLEGKAFFQPGTYMDFDGIKKNPEAPDVDQYRNAIDELIILKKNGYPMGNSIAGLKYIRNWPDPAPLKCFGGLLFVRIEADGTLRICGRDGFTDGPNVKNGVKTALDKLPGDNCKSCWSAARVEFNLIAQGHPGPLLGFFGG